MMNATLLLTKREMEAINKKLNNKKLTQQDSNCLSRFVRPKLREMSKIDSKLLLKKLEYNQKAKAIENRIKLLILNHVKNVSSITLYGSIIYSGYVNCKDVDVIISVKKKFWNKLGEKYKLITELKRKAGKKGLNLDIKVFLDKDIYESYPNNITLIYELKDSKTIYGLLSYPNKININKTDLKLHMDYSYSALLDIKENGPGNIQGREIYSAIRNIWIIRLITENIIDNIRLVKILDSELGENTIKSLKNNSASAAQKKMAAIYLKKLYSETEKIIERWEGKT